MAFSSTTSPEERSQYHHYIPRFIVRNYSHPGELPTNTTPNNNNKKKNGRNRTRAPEPMLWGIDLSSSEPQITETRVAKTFGVTDMYRDSSASSRQHQVEEQLSVLESRAGEVISKIKKEFEAGGGEGEVWLTRSQRDTLRKFLFIMKYRGKRFHKRFFHEKLEDYDADDTVEMVAYMKEKRFVRPIDVWFDNIKGILDLKIDTVGLWRERILKRIYPNDAKWFINNMDGFYLALITPREEQSEFLLSQNAYSIYEGATSEAFDPVTGRSKPVAYSEFHLFAPISPRLLIVLRTLLLPVPEEDVDPDIKRGREAMYQANAAQHTHPGQIGDLLRDLPVAKARNSYSELENGRRVLLGEGPTGTNDRFCFRFFGIDWKFVDIINGVMLEECCGQELIVFNTKRAAKDTIASYLAKRSGHLDGVDRFEYLQKLKRAVKLLAADEGMESDQYRPLPSEIMEFLKTKLPEDKLIALFAKEQKAKELYFEICKTELDAKDFDHARGLLYMRIRLDTFTRSLHAEVREQARTKFLDNYEDFPVQVIWIYLKRIRFMKAGRTNIVASGALEDLTLPVKHLYEAEDVIMRSRSLFQRKDIRRVMHHASFNASLIAKSPPWGLVSNITMDDDGMRQLQREKQLVLGDQGSIRNCGIAEVEKCAREIYQSIKDKPSPLQDHPLREIFTREEKIELHLRQCLRAREDETSKQRLDAILGAELEGMLFDVLYPQFGFRMKEDDAAEEGGLREEIVASCSLQ